MEEGRLRNKEHKTAPDSSPETLSLCAVVTRNPVPMLPFGVALQQRQQTGPWGLGQEWSQLTKPCWKITGLYKDPTQETA